MKDEKYPLIFDAFQKFAARMGQDFMLSSLGADYWKKMGEMFLLNIAKQQYKAAHEQSGLSEKDFREQYNTLWNEVDAEINRGY